MRPLEMKNSSLARLSGYLIGAAAFLLLTGLIGAVLAAPPAANPRKEIADALKSTDPVQRQAAATLIGDLSMDSPDIKEKGRFAAVRNLDEFVAELATMADRDPDLQVREAAMTALGRMRPDLDTALAPLARAISNKDKGHPVEDRDRLAAAGALGSLVRRAKPYEEVRGKIVKAAGNELVVSVSEKDNLFSVTPDTQISLEEETAKLGELRNEMAVRVLARRQKDTLTAVRIQASSRNDPTFSLSLDALYDLIGRGQEIVPIAAIALQDPVAEVRRAGADALVQIAAELITQLRQRRPSDDLETLRPLYRAFRDQTPALVEGINDPDLTVRLHLREALEDLAAAYPLVSRPGVAPAPEKVGYFEEQKPPARLRASVRADERADDTVFSDLAPIVQALVKGISDKEADARVAAIQVLENLGKNAVKATPTLVKALRDPDLFVRWTAARALGKIEASRRKANPKIPAAEGEVDGLIRLLRDTDLDVQLAAAVALEPYAEDAGKAVGPLANAAATGDPSFRLAAIHALREIGKPAHTPSAAEKLAHAVAFQVDPRVRAEAARLLGRFGPAAQGAIGALRKALKDPEPSVRRAASEALLIIPAPNPK